MKHDLPSINHLDGPRIARALRAGIASVLSDQEHLNKINVYPVPDGDTGTNLALTVQSIAPVVTGDVSTHAGQLLIKVADAALDGARGNSGAILAQWLQGVADYCESLPQLSAKDLAAGLASGAAYAREAMSEPVEGTILTVLDDYSRSVSLQVDDGVSDIAVIFLTARDAAEDSLANTPKLLEVLRKAGVVDAGAAGFVDLLNGIQGLLRDGVEGELSAVSPADDFVAEMAASDTGELRFRYCTECLVTGQDINRRKLREDITALGNSLVIAGSHAKMRIHIHTNEPEQLFSVVSAYGAVSGEKADDMQRQQNLTHASDKKVVITTDTAGDVPDDELERLNIYLTPVRVHFANQSYLDRVTITADQVYDKLRTEAVAAKTSQPAPGDFRRQFEFLKSHYRDVVSIHVSAQASGTCQAARNVVNAMADSERIFIVNSATASLGQALLVIDAAEAAQQGMSGQQVVQRLEKMKNLTQTYAVLRDLSYGVRGGRVPARVKSIADFLRLTPVLRVRSGLVKPGGVFFGRQNVVKKFARFVGRRIDKNKTYRLGVGYADCEADGKALLAQLELIIPNRHQTLITQVGPALGVHTGPDGLVVAVQEYRPVEAVV